MANSKKKPVIVRSLEIRESPPPGQTKAWRQLIQLLQERPREKGGKL